MSVNKSSNFREENSWAEYILSKTTYNWIRERRNADDTNGLWRIHDGLYDLTSFTNKHPGGKFWIEETKGMDITDAFESHHVKSDAHLKLLTNFYIGKATKLRTSPYTFNDDGFYRTLKRKVRPVLKTLPKAYQKTSDLYTDLLLLAALGTACLANYFFSYAIAIASGIITALLINATHNYCHRRDNFRMFYSDTFMASSRGTRIVHVISHHLSPNSVTDLQFLTTLPIMNPYPQKKSFYVKHFVWLNFILLCSLFIYIAAFLNSIETIITKKNYKSLILPFIVPLLMYSLGGQTFMSTLYMWQVITLCSSTTFGMIAFTTSHMHPDLYVEGDTPRPKEEMDWGINQLDTVYDRKEFIGSHFFSLVSFGDHAIHHLFPTLDHGYIIHLYPLLIETLKEFNIKNFNITTHSDLYMGFFKQMRREIPRLLPPMLPVK
ncbi:hypothetical protein FQA39_LY03061 [Lamprigera yunnana]|nr:hypothetical protein FQA39_LY03061 [Lamprigera yunnana]